MEDLNEKVDFGGNTTSYGCEEEVENRWSGLQPSCLSPNPVYYRTAKIDEENLGIEDYNQLANELEKIVIKQNNEDLEDLMPQKEKIKETRF